MSGDDTAAGEDPISELIGFLSDSRAEVRTAAATHVASLTGTVDGLSLLVKERERLLPPLLKLLHDADAKVLEQAYAALVNLSLDEDACKSLLSLGVVGRIMEILRGGHEKQGTVLTAKLLSNLTLRSEAVDELLQKGKGPLEGFFVSIIVQLLVSESGGAPEERDYFAAVLTNISQQGIGRKAFLGESAANLKLLNRELEKTASLVRQESLARVIRNVCMGSIEDASVGALVESGTIGTMVSVVSREDDESKPLGSTTKELLEGILCFATDEDGMAHLWKLNVPQIFQKLYERETDAEVCAVLERCADVFIQESGAQEEESPIEEL